MPGLNQQPEFYTELALRPPQSIEKERSSQRAYPNHSSGMHHYCLDLRTGYPNLSFYRVLPGRDYLRPPPLPPFLARRHFSGEGGGGVCFEAPRGRKFIRPPPLIHPPPLEGYFQGWGGGGV